MSHPSFLFLVIPFPSFLPAPVNGIFSCMLAHILRLLLAHHILRDVKLDMFTNNRVSMLIALAIAVPSDDPKKKKTEETEEQDKDKKEGSSKLKDGEKAGEEMVRPQKFMIFKMTAQISWYSPKRISS
jgi:hypothetical protein